MNKSERIMIKMTLNDAKEKHENCFLPDSAFQRRRSSIHLHEAERDLDIRANTLIGLTKPQVQKLVNFDNEYFKQLSNSPIGTFISPYLNPGDVLGKSTEKTPKQDGPKQTKIFIPQNKNKDSDRKTTMELRRAYSNLTTNSRIKTDKNIYQQAFKRSNTDIPEIYTDRRLNLPPLHKRSASTLSRKHLQLGSLRSQHPSFPVEQLPPIQLKPVAIGSNEYGGNLSDESVKDYQKEILNIHVYKDETNGELNNFEKVLIMRNGSTRTNQGYNRKLKLRRNKAEFNDLIDKSKSIANFPIDKTSFQRKKKIDDIGLLVVTPNTESVKEQSNFEIRKKYGKNLEQNWFKSFIQQTKTTKGDTTDGNVDFHLEMFYSPEPTEDGSVVSDIDDKCKVDSDDESKSNEMTTFERKKNLLEMSALFSSSTDVLTGENNELERDTPSDIEIVLKDNELIQKKTKHKMRKKRRKKEKRCKAMVPRETANEDVPLPIMTDKELRAIRLNIKKKTPAPVLTAKRKFLQCANAIFVAVQFRKILANIRERNRKRRNRKLKKKHRRVTWKQPTDQYAEFERSVTLPTLKDTFMKEIGNKLLRDIYKLNIISENENVVSKNGVNEEQRRNKLQSKFAVEANKASLEDVERLLTDKNRMPKKSNRIRRNSAPLLSMPEGFLIEISENSKGRRHDRSKSVRRTKSVMKKSKRCTKSPNVSKRSSSSPKATSSFGRASRSQSTSCTHKDEIAKEKHFIFHRSDVLKRRYSLDEEELKKCKEIDLSELLRDVEIPAKDIRIQIIRRKMKKQRRRKAEAIHVVIPSPKESEDSVDSESSSELEIESSSDCDEYSNKYTSPFVSAGVAWNRTTKRPTWTSVDVDREFSGVTRFFLEMKACSYIRWTGINQAIISRLDELM